MKSFNIALFALVLQVSAIAQESTMADSVRVFHDEVGINFTRFLDEAIDFGGSETALNPYLFVYRRLNNKGDGFRLGAGLDWSRSKGTLGSNFFDDEASAQDFFFDLRIGNEHQRRFSKRWYYYYGFDGLLGVANSVLKTSEAKITAQTLYIGAGPVLGAQFMISDRVGLFTESSFYLIQSFVEERTNFTSSLQDDEKTNGNGTDLSFKIPTNIYLFFKF